MWKTFDGTTKSKVQVPKLDFSGLKHNKEFKDWYKYSIKLEKSIRALRNKIKWLETDIDDWNNKNSNLRKQNSNLYSLNCKLVKNVKILKKKIIEVKEKYNRKVKRAQQMGINNLEMTMPRFETDLTYDYRQETAEKDFDDFNSNDSYDPEKRTSSINNYKEFIQMNGTMTDQNSNPDEKKFHHKEISNYILEQNDYWNTQESPVGVKKYWSVNNSSCKPTNSSGLKSPIEDQNKIDFNSTIKYPERSYKRTGLMTKITASEERIPIGNKKKVSKKIVEERLSRQNST